MIYAREYRIVEIYGENYEFTSKSHAGYQSSRTRPGSIRFGRRPHLRHASQFGLSAPSGAATRPAWHSSQSYRALPDVGRNQAGFNQSVGSGYYPSGRAQNH